MRAFGSLIGRSTGLREPGIPQARLNRVNLALKRRLEDGLEDVFNRACAARDFDAASDLLAVLEKWQARPKFRPGRERRLNRELLRRARRELERLGLSRDVPAAS